MAPRIYPISMVKQLRTSSPNNESKSKLRRLQDQSLRRDHHMIPTGDRTRKEVVLGVNRDRAEAGLKGI